MNMLNISSSPASSGSRIGSSPVVNHARGFLSDTEVILHGETHLGCPIWCLAASKSGILCGCDDGSIVLLNSNLDCCFRLQEAHGSSPVLHVTWADDGLHFMSYGTDFTVKIWTIETPEDRTATLLFTLPQISPVISAVFHPRSYADDSGFFNEPANAQLKNTCTVFVLTADRRLSMWTDGQVERYESLSAKESSPVCMSVRLVEAIPWIAIGTKTGELLIYSFLPDKGLVFEQCLVCRNRRGKFKEGTPIVSIFWVSNRDLALASQDDRVRLVRLSGSGEGHSGVIAKYKGHSSSRGEVPLTAFVVSPPFGEKVIQCGSECGKVYIWPLKHALDPIPTKRQSLLNKFTRSSASRHSDSWAAVSPPDKLTAVAPAPWSPEKAELGTSSTVTASFDGAVRIFLCKYDS